MRINKEQLTRIKKLVEDGYISVQKHPNYRLYIYNYTKKTQHERFWNEETMMCRGLILDHNGYVRALPFKKFFNYEEHLEHGWEIPKGPGLVSEKFDGSLGIMYFIGNVPFIATRGSFTSEQATHANELLRTKYKDIVFDQSQTWLFEIIYPQNRVVVDYGSRDELVCLGSISLEEDTFGLWIAPGSNVPPGIPKAPGGFLDDWKTLNKAENKREEGFVVSFLGSDVKIKMKFKEYVRLHRLYTGLTKRKIWEAMKNKEDLDVLMQSVDEEFKTYVLTAINEIKLCQHNYFDRAQSTLKYIQEKTFKGKTPTRKELATEIVKYPDTGLIFALLDNKQGHIDDFLWKISYPDAEKIFRNDIDS